MLRRLRHAGFTLVELLVTLGVIGLLLSLTLAGVQQARSAARKAQCLDRIRQLALACHEYEAVYGTFPKTASGFSRQDNAVYFLSPHVHLLPYVDQKALHESIDFNETSSGQSEPPSSRRNSHPLTTHVSAFVCPDDELAEDGATNYRACMGHGPGVIGRIPGHLAENGTGPFRYWHSPRTAEIADGLSNTVILGEKLTGDRDLSAFAPARDAAGISVSLSTTAQTQAVCAQVGPRPSEHYSYGGAAWLFGGFHATWYNHVLPPNSDIPDCGFHRGAFAARSYHPGGVNTAFADGSSRFIADNIDLSTWRAFATRDLGETTGL